MIGILVELIFSWLLLYWFDTSNFSVLGFKLTKSRTFNFLFGFFTASLFCLFYYFSTSSLADTHYSINQNFTTLDFLKSSWWVLSSVLFEELIFRGALLYISIKKFGVKRACIFSAIAFGIYHWFTFGAFGNPIQMAIVFAMTAIWGLMFAFAYAKTKALYLPIGLHLGWNLINTVIFSKGPLGHQYLIIDSDQKLDGLISLFFFVLQIIGLPILTYSYLKKSNNRNRISN
ncbi:CPBP family intramembrane glutamic endopeptidase [Flavobacterium sp. KJJ]|uniref:CPBP family intramembrane glutamic endopeptidase n=1 Tax=Flavobacterium sp. KJJ TaxID=1270193 RepID=UPI00049324D2|nr:type II CAAX endopeptidase family protein [Flavobacterium sp. KJJ]